MYSEKKEKEKEICVRSVFEKRSTDEQIARGQGFNVTFEFEYRFGVAAFCKGNVGQVAPEGSQSTTPLDHFTDLNGLGSQRLAGTGIELGIFQFIKKF